MLDVGTHLKRFLPDDRADRLGVVTLLLATVAVAALSVSEILEATDGALAVPLDDAFIHFQYARSFAELHPLAYTPGATPTPGATSLLWPAVLAPFWALGVRGASLIGVAWTLGFLALFATALETWKLTQGITSRGPAFAAGAMVVCFGGLVWCAGSGMEVVPLSWALMRTARRAADHHEGVGTPATIELCVLGLLAPALRPEGVLCSAIACAALLGRPRGRARALCLIPLLGVAVPMAVNYALTGRAETTTAQVKFLASSPYLSGSRLLDAVMHNVGVLLGTLLDGRVWAATALPEGGRWVAWLALPALAIVGFGRRRGLRTGVALLVALGLFIPTTYDSFLWNRLRYLWPFAPAWFVALAALADGVGAVAARWAAPLGGLRVGIAAGVTGALCTTVPRSIRDLAESAAAIDAQHVSIGRWAAASLPRDARIGVNDTGAIAYFSQRSVFDVVGLTTAGEARYWNAGAGSRFEHYEHMEREALPTHFIVYPAWLAAPPLLGATLTERTVHATILGGTTKLAATAHWDSLGSGHAPLAAPPGKLLDRLDVADLESESAHDYQLGVATQMDNRVFEHPSIPDWADGGRAKRTLERFRLTLEGGGTFVMRAIATHATSATVRIDGDAVGRVALVGAGSVEEPRIALPAALVDGQHAVEITVAPGRDIAVLHYWAFSRP